MPAQPFPDWLHRVDPTIYLLPECENEDAARECLSEVCTEIFERNLGIHSQAALTSKDLRRFTRWKSVNP